MTAAEPYPLQGWALDGRAEQLPMWRARYVHSRRRADALSGNALGRWHASRHGSPMDGAVHKGPAREGVGSRLALPPDPVLFAGGQACLVARRPAAVSILPSVCGLCFLLRFRVGTRIEPDDQPYFTDSRGPRSGAIGRRIAAIATPDRSERPPDDRKPHCAWKARSASGRDLLPGWRGPS